MFESVVLHTDLKGKTTRFGTDLDDVGVGGDNALAARVVTGGAVELEVHDGRVVQVVLHDQRLRLAQIEHAHLTTCSHTCVGLSGRTDRCCESSHCGGAAAG